MEALSIMVPPATGSQGEMTPDILTSFRNSLQVSHPGTKVAH